MEKLICYHDTDAGGVVYYANYLKYMEEARLEFLASRDLSDLDFRNRGLLYAVRSCNIQYKSPARYGETITCDAKLIKTSAAQLFFTQTIHEKTSNRLLTEAEVVLVCLTDQFKPTQIPKDIKDKLEK